MNEIYKEIKRLLMAGSMKMEEGEAKAVALLLLEKVCGMTAVEVLSGMGTTRLQHGELMEMARRVAEGEPVQYVLGEAEFCGMVMRVEPGVLIPRPETEELVRWVIEEGQRVRSEERGARSKGQEGWKKVLDVGTGSGCIAVALAKMLKDAEVEAWDVSDVAVRVAKGNAERNGMKVEVKKVDVMELQQGCCMENRFEVMVSNPPYICEEEAEAMERNVLEHEPRLALFVPNDDPLLFYRKIAEIGLQLLKAEGRLFFEINQRFGKEVVKLLEGMGYVGVELRCDFYGNDRMVKAIKAADVRY